MAWLVWLGLLLPMAQAAASMHAVSHVRQDTSRSNQGDLAAQAQCDLCLLGAAIGGSAPASAMPALSAVPMPQEQLPAFVGHEWLASPLRAYRSRAPPFPSH